jgi:hypothetical protein
MSNKEKVNVFDLSSIAKKLKKGRKLKVGIERSKDVFSAGGKNSSVNKSRNL